MGTDSFENSFQVSSSSLLFDFFFVFSVIVTFTFTISITFNDADCQSQTWSSLPKPWQELQYALLSLFMISSCSRRILPHFVYYLCDSSWRIWRPLLRLWYRTWWCRRFFMIVHNYYSYSSPLIVWGSWLENAKPRYLFCVVFCSLIDLRSRDGVQDERCRSV